MEKMKIKYGLIQIVIWNFLFFILVFLNAGITTAQVIEGSSDRINFNNNKGKDEGQTSSFENPEKIKYYALLIAINN